VIEVDSLSHHLVQSVPWQTDGEVPDVQPGTVGHCLVLTQTQEDVLGIHPDDDDRDLRERCRIGGLTQSLVGFSYQSDADAHHKSQDNDRTEYHTSISVDTIR
jgi:hypothetical protein